MPRCPECQIMNLKNVCRRCGRLLRRIAPSRESLSPAKPKYKPKLSLSEREARRKQIAKEIAASGADWESIKKNYGVSYGIIKRACEENGVRVPRKPSERRKRIAEEVASSGASWESIKKKYGVSYGTIKRACEENGVRVPRKPNQKSPRTLRIIAFLQKDRSLTLAEIASKFGLSKQRIHQILTTSRQAGIDIPRPDLRKLGPQIRRKAIAQQIASGLDIESVRKKFHVSYQTVRVACIENAVPIPKKPRGEGKSKAVSGRRAHPLKKMSRDSRVQREEQKKLNLAESSGMDLLIRAATERDLPAIVEIYNQSIPGG